MSGYYSFFEIQYKLGLSADRLKKAVSKDYITAAEYETITGEDYTAPTQGGNT